MKNKQLVTLLSCLMAAGTADAAVVRQIKVDGAGCPLSGFVTAF